MNAGTTTVLMSLMLLVASQSLAQRNNAMQSYRPPPPPPPAPRYNPPPPSYDTNRGAVRQGGGGATSGTSSSYGSTSRNLGGYQRGAIANQNPAPAARIPGGQGGQAAGRIAGKPATGIGAGNAPRPATAGASLFGGATTAAARTPANDNGKPGMGASTGGGGGAGASLFGRGGGSGGGKPPGTPVAANDNGRFKKGDLSETFNRAARSTKEGGVRKPEPRPRPSLSDEFGRVAMGSEKQIAGDMSKRKGTAMDRQAMARGPTVAAALPGGGTPAAKTAGPAPVAAVTPGPDCTGPVKLGHPNCLKPKFNHVAANTPAAPKPKASGPRQGPSGPRRPDDFRGP